MKLSFKQDYISERPPLHFGEGLGVRFSLCVRLFTALALFALLSASSCKRDCQEPTNPDCENYNPCYGKTQPSAKFIMEESNPLLVNQGIWYADSVFYGSMIRFRSEYTESQYKHTWYVGAEEFNTAATPNRNFNNLSRPQFITISHVLEYAPDLQCFPNDIGKDSVAQTFRLIASLNDEFQTYGTFHGALDGGTDTFDVKIVSVNIDDQPAGFNTHYQDKFINFHNRGDTLSNYNSSGLNTMGAFLYNHQGVFIKGVEGTVRVNANGTFEMHYKADGTTITGDGAWHSFKGRKIN